MKQLFRCFQFLWVAKKFRINGYLSAILALPTVRINIVMTICWWFNSLYSTPVRFLSLPHNLTNLVGRKSDGTAVGTKISFCFLRKRNMFSF